MHKLFFDIETNGTNPYTNEIITGYFVLLDKDMNFLSDYNFFSQVDSWSHEAEKIHGISHLDTLSFPAKQQALDSLSDWLSRLPLFECYLYANPNTELGYLFFDVATLQMQLMNHFQINLLEQQAFKPQKINSVYTVAKESTDYYMPIKYKDAYKLGLTDKDKHMHSNRLCYTQPGVYYALFNEVYNSHDAKDDVKAMIKIYNEINRLKDNNLKNQMDLI